MTPNPIVIRGTSTIAQVEEIFAKKQIWSIYIGEKDHYVGIITRNDLKYRMKNKNKSAPAFSIMSSGVISIDENKDVDDAKNLLTRKKINGLAVTRNGKHCGIVTWWDIKNKKPAPPNDWSPTHPPKPIPNPPDLEHKPSSPPTPFLKNLIKFLKTSPKDRKIQKNIEKVKINQSEVTKKINEIRNEINRIDGNIQSLFDKAKKSHSDPETIFFAREIKHKQSLSKSKWDTIDKLQRIQHYYDRIVDIGDLNVSLKDFGLDGFTPKQIEDFVIDTEINSEEMTEKVEYIDSISSKSTDHDAHDEDLKEILAEIRSNKK